MNKLTAFIIAAVLFLTGCAFSADNDEQNINDVISTFSTLTLGVYETGEESDASKDAILPLAWYRSKNTDEASEYTISAEITGDSAFVEITGSFSGIMNVFYADSIGDTIHLEKTFTDSLTRFAVLKKDTLKEYHGGWRLIKVTDGYLFTSSPLVSIDSLKLAGTSIDTVITDVFEFFDKDELLSVSPGEQVEITLFSQDTTSLFFAHSDLRRGRLTGGEGVYTKIWTAPLTTGRYRLVLDGITVSTIYDDIEDYNAIAWVIPYTVE